MRSTTLLAVVVYPSAMVIANLTVATFGPVVSPINAFLLIGLDLTLRDWLQVRLKVLHLIGLIVLSGILSYLLNPSSGMIAVASLLAFVVSAIIDYAIFSITKGSWLKRTTTSNSVASVVDSILFPTIAFGVVMPEIIAMQSIAKIAGGLLWSFVLKKD